jgi:hypothetical protein
MKKQLLQLIFTALAVILFSNTINAAPWPPVRSMVLSSAWQDMVMDGVDSEGSYGETQGTYIYDPSDWDGTDEDFSAVFRMTWDYSFLYVYAEITDDIEESYKEGIGNSWRFDNCQVFLQLDTNTVVWGYSAVTAIVQLNRGYTAIQWTGHTDRFDFIYSAHSNPNSGWTFEMGIPWTAAMPIDSSPEDVYNYLEDGKTIGFDIRFIDQDAWNPDSDDISGSEWDEDDPEEPHDIEMPSIYDHPKYFGYITLDAGNLLSGNYEDYHDKIIAGPNPAGNMIQFLNLEQSAEITIYNSTGVELRKIIYSPFEEIDISSLQSGLYIAVIGGQESVKFIKE